jgi:metal-responsive CopG/Arc/MetJ family transcriptional regulator
MPPNGFESVSLDKETLQQVDDIRDALDLSGRPEALRVAVEAFDVEDYQNE